MTEHQPARESPGAVRTYPVGVRVFVRNGAVIEGRVHIRPGAYQRRVSDILNLGKLRYVAITDATYTVADGDATTTECVLVNVDDIVMLDVTPADLPPGTSLTD